MNRRILQQFSILILLLIVAIIGCVPSPKFHSAPVVNGWKTSTAGKNAYTVRRTDTLYSIAWAFGMDYRDLAAVNHLHSPYKLRAGQKIYITKPQVSRKSSPVNVVRKTGIKELRVTGQKVPVTSVVPKAVAVTKLVPVPQQKAAVASHLEKVPEQKTTAAPHLEKVPVQNIAVAAPHREKVPVQKASIATPHLEKVPQQKNVHWRWPANGKIVGNFNNQLGGNKGVDIVGRFGAPVVAAASGRIVYSGTGIRSYGNLIIIKHTDDYLSAYAYNKRMLVHEGQLVKQGQKIAEIGKNDAGCVMLHFEIRHNGKPVNPLVYLGK